MAGVPQARYLGVTPQDIVDYQLPTHPLLEMGVRAEQQALAKSGLNYVIEEVLPRKLSQTASFLP